MLKLTPLFYTLINRISAAIGINHALLKLNQVSVKPHEKRRREMDRMVETILGTTLGYIPRLPLFSKLYTYLRL